MIRYAFINNSILEIYRKLPNISFPLDLQSVIDLFPNCKYMSYQTFAKINDCTIDDVIQLCESRSGCTHYDVSNDRYLILCNQATAQNNNIGRQRWTCGHEIGHIICHHHRISAYNKLSENCLLKIENKDFEAEADYFAATILSPFPFFKLFNVSSPRDVQDIFYLSAEASANRYTQYLRWLPSRRKTAWENDIIKVYLSKNHNAL